MLTELTNEANRALFGVGRAFHIGRLTVVDAECYEAMGAAFNNFSRLQGALEGVAEWRRTASMREKMASIVLFTGGLNREMVTLVKAGQKRLSPVQTWWNKRRREEVRKRQDATHFQPPHKIAGR